MDDPNQPPIELVAAHMNGNDRLRALLAENGDDGTAAAEVRHHLSPHPDREMFPAARADLAEALRKMGWFVEDGPDGGLLLTEVREVASGAFNRHTATLAWLANGAGWLYDGWERAVPTES